MIDIAATAETPVEEQQQAEEITREPKKDKQGRAYGTGRRKESTARVWIKAGKGDFIVNGQKMDDYFVRPVSRMIINQPFVATETQGKFDVICTVVGGGSSGQAGAVRHGISRALDNFDPVAYHTILRRGGYLTRDSRVVERKKYGRRKARRKFQFSKR